MTTGRNNRVLPIFIHQRDTRTFECSPFFNFRRKEDRKTETKTLLCDVNTLAFRKSTPQSLKRGRHHKKLKTGSPRVNSNQSKSNTEKTEDQKTSSEAKSSVYSASSTTAREVIDTIEGDWTKYSKLLAKVDEEETGLNIRNKREATTFGVIKIHYSNPVTHSISDLTFQTGRI
jgi:hypothetical protein